MDIFLWCLSVLVFFFDLNFRVFNPSLFETNFRTLLRENTFARAKRSSLFTRKKRTKKSLKEENRRRERWFSSFFFFCVVKRVRLFWSLSVVSVNYIIHIKSQKPRRRDTRMEHHESATLMTANDDERVALLLKSGSKRMMTPVSSSFTQKRTAAPTMKAVSIACFVCFCAFAFVSRNHPLKTYLENRLIVQTLGVKPSDVASSSSCEDIVERETQAMTFYATDLFGWSPFVETRLDASYKRRSLKYSLSRSSASAAESSEPSEKEEEEEEDEVAIASPTEIENEVGGTDTSEDERGERQQQQLVVAGSEEEEEVEGEEAATTTATTTDEDNNDAPDDDESTAKTTSENEEDGESSVGRKEVREYENEDEESTEKAAAEKLANAKELLFVPPDKTPYRYAFIDWLKPALQDDPRIANHINDADMVLFTDSFADANPYMAKFLHENDVEDEESRAKWWSEQKDNSKVLAQNLFSRMSKEKDQASRAVAFSNFLFPSERFILREKDEIGVPEYAQVGSDAVVGDNKKNSNVFIAVTDVSPAHIWEKAYKTNGIAMLVPFTANSDIARASLKLKNNFFYERERPEMFYTGDLEFLHDTMQAPMKNLISAEGQNIHLGKSKSLNSDNDVKDYAEGSLRSSFCWIPRSYDKARFETSTRVIDSIAAGCIPVVVVDSIAESLPFKWAVDYKSFMLQVPEKIFVENPLEVAEAVSKISSNALQAMRSKMLDARAKLVWNDQNDAGDACDKDTGRCSLAPKLFLDEILYRVKQNNAEIQSAMCDRRTDGDGSSDWVDGGVWTGEKLCAPWLAKTGLCKASKKDSEREEREESASSKEEDGGETAAEKAVDATTNEETDEKAPESGGEEQVDEKEEKEGEEEAGSSNSFDINEELEAAISGKSRAEKMEEIEAEQKAASEKENLKKARKESERKQIEEALKRQEDGNYELEEEKSIKKEDLKEEIEEQPETAEEKMDTSAMESSIEDEIAATVQPEAKISTPSNDSIASEGEEEEAGSDVKKESDDEQEAREEEERNTSAMESEMESNIEDEIAATVQPSAVITSAAAGESSEEEKETGGEEEQQKEKTPEEEAQDLAEDFASASDSGQDSKSFGEDLYNKLMGGNSIKSATTDDSTTSSSPTSSASTEDNTGIDLDQFETSSKKASDVEDGDPDGDDASRDDADDGWSSSLDNESY